MGDRYIDHMRATRLNRMVIEFCQKNLKEGGNLLMKIIQGPAEKELAKEAELYFKSMQRVKPTASRNVSAETYYLCYGFMQSTNKDAVEMKEMMNELDRNQDNPQAQKQIYEELFEKTKVELQQAIDEIHKRGDELPEKIQDFIKTSSVNTHINIENKMSIRERARARQQ